MNKLIAECIIAAQIASDSGKGKDELYEELCVRYVHNAEFEKAWIFGYGVKDHYIFQAMSEIRCSKSREFYYYVGRDEATGRNGSYIVYFNFKIEGKRYQVSFHSFCKKLALYVKDKGHCKTEWDRKSSRQACAELACACNGFYASFDA